MSLNRDLQERVEQLEAALYESSMEKQVATREELADRLKKVKKLLSSF